MSHLLRLFFGFWFRVSIPISFFGQLKPLSSFLLLIYQLLFCSVFGSFSEALFGAPGRLRVGSGSAPGGFRVGSGSAPGGFRVRSGSTSGDFRVGSG
jgi:hypothetical protein